MRSLVVGSRGSSRWSRAVLPVVLSLAGAAISFGVNAAPAWAVIPARLGYVWADQPTSPSYTPSLLYQKNSTGHHNTITRFGTGAYRVSFPGLGTGGINGGTVDVTAYGTSGYCKVEGWFASGTTMFVNVLCFGVGGSSADLRFDATFSNPGSTSPAAAYIWADSPTASSYTPALFYQYNSGGGTNTIVRNATGDYSVSIPTIGANAGTVKVSGYGSDSTNCQVRNWGGTPTLTVNVLCHDAVGNPADAYFAMTWVNKATPLITKGHKGGYVWANQPTASSYTPSPFYSWNSSGATNTVTRLSTGVYDVYLPNIGANNGDVQATAYFTPFAECNSNGWGTSGTSQVVGVACYDMNGNPIDTYFTVQYLR